MLLTLAPIALRTLHISGYNRVSARARVVRLLESARDAEEDGVVSLICYDAEPRYTGIQITPFGFSLRLP